jgi:hypothetical protein
VTEDVPNYEDDLQDWTTIGLQLAGNILQMLRVYQRRRKTTVKKAKLSSYRPGQALGVPGG